MWFFFVNSTLLKHKTQVRNNSTADDQKEKRKKLMSYSFRGRVELSTAQPCAGVLVPIVINKFKPKYAEERLLGLHSKEVLLRHRSNFFKCNPNNLCSEFGWNSFITIGNSVP